MPGTCPPVFQNHAAQAPQDKYPHGIWDFWTKFVRSLCVCVTKQTNIAL